MTQALQTLEITRQFKAPRERVFDAFSSFDAMKEWFGPGTCNCTGGAVEFAVGGHYHLKMEKPGGEMTVLGTYVEIQPPSRIVFTWKWDDDEDWNNVESTVELDFIASGTGTELRLLQTGFPNEESRGRHTQGWTGGFDKLERVVDGRAD
ncbi:MAG: SRPBCC domain-containing protein [Verrucomicrobia bacterium]|nr:SRPBCC domain-containing protein [Verrucomicrobiota bacterium]